MGMIRQFDTRDAASCCEIIHSCLRLDSTISAALRLKIINGETPQSIRERARLFYIAVYESGDRVLGLAGLDMNEIRLVYVSPDCQHQGIGRSLVDHVKAMVPAALFQEIFVYSTSGAVGFYGACGFTDRGPYLLDLSGEHLKTVFMTCPTSPNIRM
jgi:GNAT superfamily N-acetyltransferase